MVADAKEWIQPEPNANWAMNMPVSIENAWRTVPWGSSANTMARGKAMSMPRVYLTWSAGNPMPAPKSMAHASSAGTRNTVVWLAYESSTSAVLVSHASKVAMMHDAH